jgi:hypothetical protein
MAYLLGASTTDVIDCGTLVPHAGTFSVFLRLALTSVNDTVLRRLLDFRQPTGRFFGNCQLEVVPAIGVNNGLQFAFSEDAGVGSFVNWVSVLTAGVIHTLVGTFDGTTLRIYADTDATPKGATVASFTPDQGAEQEFAIGGLAGFNNSADATIYEVAWFPSVVLTGAQAALLGGGGPMPVGFPLPAHYWPLTEDADDLYGGANGVVTGTTAGAVVGTSWFPLSSVDSSTLLLLLQRGGGGRFD